MEAGSWNAPMAPHQKFTNRVPGTAAVVKTEKPTALSSWIMFNRWNQHQIAKARAGSPLGSPAMVTRWYKMLNRWRHVKTCEDPIFLNCRGWSGRGRGRAEPASIAGMWRPCALDSFNPHPMTSLCHCPNEISSELTTASTPALQTKNGSKKQVGTAAADIVHPSWVWLPRRCSRNSRDDHTSALNQR